MAPQKGKRKVKTSARESMRKRGILKVPKGAPVCHSRSALAIRPAISCLLGCCRSADHAVARSRHGFAAACDVLSATLSAQSRRQTPDHRARSSLSADGIARGLRGECTERTEPGPRPRRHSRRRLRPARLRRRSRRAPSRRARRASSATSSYCPSAAPHVRAERGRPVGAMLDEAFVSRAPRASTRATSAPRRAYAAAFAKARAAPHLPLEVNLRTVLTASSASDVARTRS